MEAADTEVGAIGAGMEGEGIGVDTEVGDTGAGMAVTVEAGEGIIGVDTDTTAEATEGTMVGHTITNPTMDTMTTRTTITLPTTTAPSRPLG